MATLASRDDRIEWLGVDWSADYQEQIKHELAKRYHIETERFDRKVCTGVIREDGIMPVTPEERRLSNQNAIVLRDRLIQEAERYGISPKEMRKAISHFDYRSVQHLV